MTAKTILCCDVCSCSINFASPRDAFTFEEKEIHICRPCQYELLAAMLLQLTRFPNEVLHALQAKYQPTLLKEGS